MKVLCPTCEEWIDLEDGVIRLHVHVETSLDPKKNGQVIRAGVCKGSGDRDQECPECDGSGKINARCPRCRGGGCPQCGDVGIDGEKPCPDCEGGRIELETEGEKS